VRRNSARVFSWRRLPTISAGGFPYGITLSRVSLKKAQAELGFKGGTRSETECNQWAAAEKERLAEIMLQHDIEWEKKGTHEKHLSVLDFEKQERQ